MSVQFSQEGAVTIVAIGPRLDSNNAADVERAIADQVQGNGLRVVVDCSGLDYISSAGLRVVLLLAKRLRGTQGRLALYGMQPTIREVFEISGFLNILAVFATREEAFTSVS